MLDAKEEGLETQVVAVSTRSRPPVTAPMPYPPTTETKPPGLQILSAMGTLIIAIPLRLSISIGHGDAGHQDFPDLSRFHDFVVNLSSASHAVDAIRNSPPSVPCLTSCR
ncbi:hypothetical protein TIFTF001_009061 [Ficus carica]|uniref:Uncharacterized protein n=1 Tax=Ficus carica TaxID=3494 RepID=A0AA87ZTL8_FICCA|nr:hypothetical protein TIFTF001_009061 [Ficus carica]